MKKIEVVAAVIVDQKNKYMCVQRGINSKSYLSEKWEFPCGKIKDNESLISQILNDNFLNF